MKRILVAGFAQETNCFNPVTSVWEDFAPSECLGDAMYELKDKGCAAGGIMKALMAREDVEIIPCCSYEAQSCGAAEHAVLERALAQVLDGIAQAGKLDGVFLSLHGATQTTEEHDGCGYFIEQVRKAVGPDVTIAVALDLHGNVTKRIFDNANVVCGFHQYPHIDTNETGCRAARAGLRHMEQPLAKAGMRVPVIFGASVYTTREGPVKELMDHAADIAPEYGVAEYSIFQMQPWLDVPDAGASIIAYGYDEEKLKAFVDEMTKWELELANKIQPNQCSLDEVVAAAKGHELGRPYVICNAADSPNAGATGDDAAVLAHILANAPDLRFAFALADAPAVRKAHELGVGKTATFQLGGTLNPLSTKVEVEARVKNLSDGVFTQICAQFAGVTSNMGLAATLQIGNILVLVCERLVGVSEPQMYRINGIEPLLCQLVDVKACTSFRANYTSFCAGIFDADTPGAATANLLRLPFRNIPRPCFPFDPVEEAAKHCRPM